MLDKTRIVLIIKKIEKYFSDLESLSLSNTSIEDPKTYYASSMVMFAILNSAIDLALEIIKAESLGIPKTYADHFKILAENKIISKKLSEEMVSLVKDRNILSHEYGEIEKDYILDIQNRIFSVKKLIEEISRWASD